MVNPNPEYGTFYMGEAKIKEVLTQSSEISPKTDNHPVTQNGHVYEVLGGEGEQKVNEKQEVNKGQKDSLTPFGNVIKSIKQIWSESVSNLNKMLTVVNSEVGAFTAKVIEKFNSLETKTRNTFLKTSSPQNTSEGEYGGAQSEAKESHYGALGNKTAPDESEYKPLRGEFDPLSKKDSQKEGEYAGSPESENSDSVSRQNVSSSKNEKIEVMDFPRTEEFVGAGEFKDIFFVSPDAILPETITDKLGTTNGRFVIGIEKSTGNANTKFYSDEVKPILLMRTRMEELTQKDQQEVAQMLQAESQVSTGLVAGNILATPKEEMSSPSLKTKAIEVKDPSGNKTDSKIVKWAKKNIVWSVPIENKEGKMAIVARYYEKRDLKANLEAEKKGKGLTPQQKWQGLYNAAKGLAALHAMNIAHGDIAARNMLVLEDSKSKKEGTKYRFVINDFGLASGVNEETGVGNLDYKRTRLPLRSIPPEQKEDSISKQADVWAFGIAMLEVLYGANFAKVFNEKAFDHKKGVNIGSRNDGVNSYITNKIEIYTKDPKNKVPDELKFNEDGTFPATLSLIFRCFNNNPNDRPTMQELVAAMKDPSTVQDTNVYHKMTNQIQETTNQIQNSELQINQSQNVSNVNETIKIKQDPLALVRDTKAYHGDVIQKGIKMLRDQGIDEETITKFINEYPLKILNEEKNPAFLIRKPGNEQNSKGYVVTTINGTNIQSTMITNNSNTGTWQTHYQKGHFQMTNTYETLEEFITKKLPNGMEKVEGNPEKKYSGGVPVPSDEKLKEILQGYGYKP